MADFRRWFTVLAVLALMAGVASAQVGVAQANGSANSAFACNATAAGTPQLRPEGFTELVGDIVISCTGGQLPAVGGVIPTTNITVYIQGGSGVVTSRWLASNGASEALLIIDEAGSGVATGAPGYGPQAVQQACSTSQQQALGGSSCGQFVGSAPGKDSAGNPVNYEVAVNATGATSANVYQGKVGDFGAASVTFYGVPVLPPGTTGVTRTYRITNVRVPGAGLTPGGGSWTASLSTNGSTALPVSGTAINVAVPGNPVKAAISLASKQFSQCVGVSNKTPQISASLTFTEGFATGFKTRVVPGGTANATPGNGAGNTLYAAEGSNSTLFAANSSIQNTPGGLYGGFAQNSESGFIFPALASGTATTASTAGLADYGTRLKAIFSNIPSGLTLYVSVVSNGTAASNTLPPVVGGTSLIPYAVLVATNSGETNVDGTQVTFGPPIASTVTGSDGLGAIALSTNTSTNTATAVWEITNSNPSATDSVTFSVYIAYSPQSASGAAGSATFYGLPVTGAPGQAPNNVLLTMAPEPSQGAFTAATLQGTGLSIPRFTTSPPVQGPWVKISLCQTTLLYPFVTGAQASGFDTGIAVANTSVDPFGTVPQTGSCTLYPYGVTTSASGVNTTVNGTATPLLGCDYFAVSGSIGAQPGYNCFPIVPAGTVGSLQADNAFPAFTGYVIAICNFQYAHGYAAVTDLGIQHILSSYLALELAPEQTISCSGGGTGGSSVSCALSNSPGSPRSGIQSIESLIH